MNNIVREQFKVISWKNWLLIKRNPGDLVVDVLYPILFLCILVGVSSGVDNEYYSERLLYNDVYADSLFTGNILKEGSHVAFLPVDSGDCQNSLLSPLIYLFNNTLTSSGINTVIHCLASEEDLQTLSIQENLVVAFDFDDPESLYSNKSVAYRIRPNYDLFSVLNWVNYVNTTHQQPNSQAEVFTSVFIPMQRSMDYLISVVKNSSSSFYPMIFKQFPSLDYFADTRVTALAGMLPPYLAIVIAFPMMTIAARLLEEREKRVQEAMLMTGLNEFVWYLSWYFAFFVRCVLISIVGTILCSLFIFEKTPWYIIFICLFLMGFVMTSYSLGLTSLFDKSATGAGVIILILIFGSMPASFIAEMHTYIYGILSFLLPPAATAEIGALLVYADSVQSKGLHFSNLFDPSASSLGVNAGILLVTLFISGFLWIGFGFYLNKIVKHRYGRREKCCYCTSKEYCDRHKIIPENADLSDVDDMRGENIEVVDKDIQKRDGIKILHLTKSFPATNKKNPPVVAVDDFSVAFYEGQITALLGHNGAGKSTLISVLTGLYDATDGDAFFYGNSLLHQMEDIRKWLGVCPQQNLLIDVLTCREHLELFGRLRNVDREKLPSLIEEALKDIDMLDKADAQVKTLSGGMKRRLNVAMALIGDPRVVLLDEPTSGMDPTSRHQIWEYLEKKKQGRVIVLCTHFMDEADFLGDRIVVMAHGKLQVAGSSLFLKSQYGLGYHFDIAKDAGADDNTILSLIQSYIPEAKIEDTNHTSVTINVPREKVNCFADTLEALEGKKEELHISSSGVASTSLEEVFLNLASEAEMGADVSSNADNTTPSPVQSSSAHNQMEFPVSECHFSVTTQIRTLFWKKCLMSIRQKKELLQQTVVPMYCVVLGVLMFFLGDFFFNIETSSTLSLDESVLYTNTLNHDLGVLYIYKNATEKDLMERWIGNQIPLYPDSNLTASDVSSAIGDVTDDSVIAQYLLNKTCNLVLIQPIDLGTTLAIRMWYNTSYSGVIPFMQNTIDSGILNSNRHTTGLSLNASYESLPVSTQNSSVFKILFTIFFCIYVCEGLNMMPIYAGIAVARERISQARLQQRLMGVYDWFYWLSNFCFDLLIGIPVIIVFFVISYFVASGMKAIALPLSVVILLFLWACLPFCYWLSLPYKSVSSAEKNLSNIVMLTMLAAMLVTFVLQSINLDSDIINLINSVLYIVPGYSIMDTMYRVSTYFSVVSLVPGMPIPSPWKWEWCGRAIIYLIVEGFAFFILLIISERRSWIKLGKVSFNKETYQPEDEDVANEIQRVHTERSDAIHVDGIWKVYPGNKKNPPVEACRDVTFGVCDGDCFGLIGPNGAGKTSIISILVGTLGYNSGSCMVKNCPIPEDIHKAYTYLGYCPQFDVLFDFMTVYECLWFYGMIKGIDKIQLKSIIDQCLDALALSEHRDKFTRDLSGGNKRRLCVAIAFMGNPQVVIMDEPSTGLDPVSRRKLWNIIKSSSNTRSFLLTTHLMEEADALCNRIAIMVNGQIQALGSGPHLKSKYGDGYTLDFKVEDKPGKMEAMQQFLESNIGKYQTRECHGCHAIVILPTTHPMSFVFRLLEDNKKTLEIVDYTLSQSTLDQVFLQFAKHQKEETVMLTQEEALKSE